jgi:hypothetical protein
MANVDSADQRIAISYLVAQGWTEAAARELLTRKREDPAQVAANQLGLLGWNKDEIARFIAGPEKAAKTAESLYRAVAGATADTRTAFASVLRQGGAGDVTIPDVKVSARKVTAKAKPTDLGALLAGFADLPANEQKRFLSLLTKEPPGGRESSSGKLPNPDVLYGPLIKGGVEAVTTALKKLLGTDSGGKTAGDGQGKKPSKGSGDRTSMDDKGKQPEPTGPSDTDDKEPSDTDDYEPSDTETNEPSDTDKAEITTEDDRSDLPDTDTDIGVIDAPDDDIDLPDQSEVDDSGAQPNDSSDSSPVDASEPD